MKRNIKKFNPTNSVWRKYPDTNSIVVIECRHCGQANHFEKKDVWNIAKEIIKIYLWK